MSSDQIVRAFFGIVALAASVCYPPWMLSAVATTPAAYAMPRTINVPPASNYEALWKQQSELQPFYTSQVLNCSTDYAPLWDPPRANGNDQRGFQIDVTRLLMEWAVIIPLFLLFIHAGRTVPAGQSLGKGVQA